MATILYLLTFSTMLKFIVKMWAIGLGLFFSLIGLSSAAYTGSVDYVAASSNIWDGQYAAFLDLVNSPIGYLLMFILGIKLLKWMGFELKSMTPGGKKS